MGSFVSSCYLSCRETVWIQENIFDPFLGLCFNSSYINWVRDDCCLHFYSKLNQKKAKRFFVIDKRYYITEWLIDCLRSNATSGFYEVISSKMFPIEEKLVILEEIICEGKISSFRLVSLVWLDFFSPLIVDRQTGIIQHPLFHVLIAFICVH